jgi:hypothetical protein
MPVFTFWSAAAIRAYLLARVEPGPGGCMLWKMGLDRRGYARCHGLGRSDRAARASYRAFVGPIPPGHDIHHLCQNRNCINPAHLEPMAHGVHLRLHAATGAWAGEKNSQAKLTEEEARFIKVAGPHVSAQALADQFGVSLTTVYYARRHGWPHVDLPDFPPRPLAEVLQAGREASQKALAVLQRVQQDRRERGEPQPPHIEHIITLARLCAGLS